MNQKLILLASIVWLAGCAHGRPAAPPAAEPQPPKVQAPAPTAAGAQAASVIGQVSDEDFDAFDKEFGAGSKQMKPVRDPLRGYNRAMFWFNDKVYFYFAKPVSIGYDFVLPLFVRTAVQSAFDNIRAPLRMVNNFLMGRFKASGTELTRLLVNSTLGVGGLWDPADRLFKIKEVDADFGMTLGHYGVGYGFPIVIPFLGQTNLRDGIMWLPEAYVDPTYYVTSFWDYFYLTAGKDFNYITLHESEYEKIKKDAIDPYTFIRDAHIQYRTELIKESRGEK